MNTETPSDVPGFLIMSIAPVTGHDESLADLMRLNKLAGGTLLAAGNSVSNACLEIGTPPKSVLISLWPSQAAATEAWANMIPAATDLGDALTVLAGTCLPQTGLPDLPTLENAAEIVSPGPAAYMLVEGTMSEPVAMGRYRDIIFPMIMGCGAYYIVYAAATDVVVLNGHWTEDALIVSRWPDHAAAKGFWYSDRYQHVAIPTRVDAGRFSVILLSGDR